MLTAAHPWAFAGLAALPLLWWWHRARQRPVDLSWPSLLLWKRLPVPDPEALARHRRRADLTLWFALAGVLAMVGGAAEMSWSARSRESLRVAVVLDATASARGPFAAIRSDAEEFVKGLPAETVVDVAIVPVGAWAGRTREAALALIREAAPTDAGGDPAAAAAAFAGDDLIVAFSDRPGPAAVARWRVHPATADVQAVESLDVVLGQILAVIRGTPGTRVSVMAGGSGDSEKVEVTIAESGRALLRRATAVEGQVSVVLDVHDGFPSNDARFWCPASYPVIVGLAGRDFPALRRALEGAGLLPEIGGTPSIWVGSVPDSIPTGPAVIIDPPAGVPGLFELDGDAASPEARILEPDHALLKVSAAADLARLSAGKTRNLRFTRPVQVLVEPYIYLADRTLILAFDPSAPNSNWTGLISFPLFWADAARLFRPVRARILSTGDALPGRDGLNPYLNTGFFTHDGAPVAVNLDAPEELSAAVSPAAPESPHLDLPDRTVIRSSHTVPPALGALAGLFLLAISWLVARPHRR